MNIDKTSPIILSVLSQMILRIGMNTEKYLVKISKAVKIHSLSTSNLHLRGVAYMTSQQDY